MARTQDANPGISFYGIKYIILGEGRSRMLCRMDFDSPGATPQPLGRYRGQFEVEIETKRLFSFVRGRLDGMEKMAGAGLMFELGERVETGDRVKATVYVYEPQNRSLAEFGRFKKD